MKSRIAYLAAGVVALAFVLLLTWFDLTIPLNFRQPVVSPDGDYFAYFDRAEEPEGTEPPYDLIVSTPAGEIVARYPMTPGRISWSNAGHLMVERDQVSQATLIPRAAGSFVVLTTLSLRPGTHPLWAQSGTKFAFVQKGKSGPDISIYDLLQTQLAPVPLPASLRLDNPILLFWSPGGQELYFANTEGKESVLYKANVNSGEAAPIARPQVAWDSVVPPRPSISPDGARIYLPKPQQSVMDADNGATIWALPADAKALWSPWSADGAEIYFSRSSAPGRIYAHDFAKGTDQEVLAGVSPNGFFSEDGRSYFFKDLTNLHPGAYGSRLREWLRSEGGWKQANLGIQTTQPLGRVELWPRSVTHGGGIAAFQDDLLRVRYGLFDPQARAFSGFQIPTDRETVRSLLKSRAVLLLAVALYGLLGFFVYLARPASASARALYGLSLVLMLLFISLDLARSLQAAYGQQNPLAYDVELSSLGWIPFLPRAYWLEDQFPLFLLFLSCVPPALLRFSLCFPERSRFLAPRSAVKGLLYVVAFLPLAFTLISIAGGEFLNEARPWLAGLAVSCGAIVIATAFLALLYNHRHPPDRRAREQVRWVLIAFSVPVAGSLLLVAASFAGRIPAFSGMTNWNALSTASLGPLWLFTPLAIGYALLAHKLFDIQLLFQRTLRYSLLTGVVAVVYAFLAGGLSWAIYGGLGRPSMVVLVVATVLTAIILAPARTRLERLIDRNFSREHFDFRETLEGFAQGLPSLQDRRTLATVTSRVVRAAMKAQTFSMFALDRKTGKLRYLPTERESRAEARATPQSGIEFDPAELLCRYLVERNRPFEVEVSPYDAKLIPIFQSAADRFSSLRAAILFGLIRRRELIGLMALGEKINDEFYNAEDIRLLQMVARQAAITLEKTEVFEEVACEDETAIDSAAEELPGQYSPAVAPEMKGCVLAGRTAAAQPAGGDYYDFLSLPDEKLGVAIGTVSGRGDPAAALKANLQNLLKSQAGSEKNLSSLVRRINRQLFTSFRGAKYCTYFYCVYEPRERRLEFVNAGHNPPLVLGPKGIRFLVSTGVPLGLFAETTHDARLETLEPGALLVLFSDGVTSARDRLGELYGLDRLMASVTRAAGLDEAGMAEKILNDVRDFTDRRPLDEDRTVVVLKVTET